ncbi:MAG: dienelactone hydrolase family protein [Candidatus Eremiobacteraeota bacterium]|nr:dienelactone hydrolase family protein [Candidatus Eremiobacteraeota bacterium]
MTVQRYLRVQCPAEVQLSAVSIRTGDAVLDADLTIPSAAAGCVIFVHGSGSSRFSRRNKHVAKVLNDATFATLLADLLTPGEAALDERTRALRFDIALLAQRTVALVDWMKSNAEHPFENIGLFGASTGAAAAIIAAAHRSDDVKAVVSRGGRIDLAGDALSQLQAPLLTIVGDRDEPLIPMHEAALKHVTVNQRSVIVPHAGHLFEEPGALDVVARAAVEWFGTFLR